MVYIVLKIMSGKWRLPLLIHWLKQNLLFLITRSNKLMGMLAVLPEYPGLAESVGGWWGPMISNIPAKSNHVGTKWVNALASSNHLPIKWAGLGNALATGPPKPLKYWPLLHPAKIMCFLSSFYQVVVQKTPRAYWHNALQWLTVHFPRKPMTR